MKIAMGLRGLRGSPWSPFENRPGPILGGAADSDVLAASGPNTMERLKG